MNILIYGQVEYNFTGMTEIVQTKLKGFNVGSVFIECYSPFSETGFSDVNGLGDVVEIYSDQTKHLYDSYMFSIGTEHYLEKNCKGPLACFTPEGFQRIRNISSFFNTKVKNKQSCVKVDGFPHIIEGRTGKYSVDSRGFLLTEDAVERVWSLFYYVSNNLVETEMDLGEIMFRFFISQGIHFGV